MLRQLFLFPILVGLALSAPSNKVDPELKTVLSSQGRVNVVVSFHQNIDMVHRRINSMRFASRGAKITAMKAQLEELRDSSQKTALRILSTQSVKTYSLWINNRMYIEDATPELVTAIASLPEVAEVREEYVIQLENMNPVESSSNEYTEWGISKIQAEQAWALPGGNNGGGVVVGVIDSGVRGTHTALRNNYRTPYGWFDPAGRLTPIPSDSEGHGTHVTGIIVGAGGIGVAPGAEWIACHACTWSGCTERSLSRCGQWITCPTLPDESEPDCSKAPHISSNSWGGRQGWTFYDTIIDAWHTAGIIPVFANGNSGPECGTVISPGDRPNVIGVGATNDTDVISEFSSRGPSINGDLKPDVSAPGENIRSAWMRTDTAYSISSGTSMATPHVSGVIALLLSMNPNLTYAQIKDLLQNNADRDLPDAESCDAHPPSQFPNNVYGYGRINARRALEAAINGLKF